MSRLAERYKSEVATALQKEFGYTNVMAIPKLERIVVNKGLGEATQNSKLIVGITASRFPPGRPSLPLWGKGINGYFNA